MRRLRTAPTLWRGGRLLSRVALTLLVAIPFAEAQEPGDPRGAGQAEAQPGSTERPEGPLDPQPPEVEPETAAPEMSDDIDEMVVRGRQRDDLLQDVSVSVTAFNTAELQALRIRNIADLAGYTPNLEINTAFAASNPTLFIRGIGLKDYNANAAGAVAVYQDGININSPAIQLFQLFDVESVEILRGPQGSLNGRNATAGAIMVKSVLPGDEFDISGRFTYGKYNTLEVEGAVTVPLIEDVLSARGAFTVNFRDGTTKNLCADWDPVAQGFGIEVLAEEGIDPVITAATTAETYNLLRPHPQPIRVQQYRDRGFGLKPIGTEVVGFVYLNTDFARRLGEANVANVQRGANPDTTPPFSGQNSLNQWQLNEALTLDDGTVVPVGTPVGIQAESFQLNDAATDGVCLVQAPGLMVTHEGATRPEPLGPTGEYVPFIGLVNLEDFQGLKRHLNDIDNWAARGILRFQPFDGMEWILNSHGGRNRSDSRHLQSLGAEGDFTGIMFQEALEAGLWSEAAAARIMQGRGSSEGTRDVDGLEPMGDFPGEGGSDPFKGFYNLDGSEFLDTWGLSLRGHWDLGGALVTSLTGYEWYHRFVEDEGDASPINSFPADYEDSAWQLSQELRAEGEGERYIWRTGFFFLYEDLDSFNLFPDTRKFRIEQTFDQTLWSLAPFAAGRLFLTEELSLDAGLRYNVEHKEFTLGTLAVGTVSGIEFDEIPEQTDKKTWTGVTGDATLSWQPTGDWLYAAGVDSLTVYGKYARGMKGGHFNAGLTIRGSFAEAGSGEILIPRVEAVKPEFIHSVEVGFKSRWLEDRLTLNVAAFRYWYNDLQVFDIINEKGELPLQQLLNGDARVWGAEAELQARPLPGLLIQLGGGWLDTEFIDLSVTKAVGQPRGLGASAEFDYSGNPLIAAPTWNLSGIVEYQIPLFRFGSLIPRYDFSYRSKVYLDPQHADPISQDPYTLHNARLAYRTPDGRIEVAGWVRNFTDKRYKIDVFDFSRDFNTILEVWGDPRTYGVTTSYAW